MRVSIATLCQSHTNLITFNMRNMLSVCLTGNPNIAESKYLGLFTLHIVIQTSRLEVAARILAIIP